MRSREEVVELRAQARRGEGIRALAQALGVSRNTARRYLRGARAGERKKVERRSKLDELKDYLVERIEAARPDWIPATVRYREIVEGAKKPFSFFGQKVPSPAY
jgi:transposase